MRRKAWQGATRRTVRSSLAVIVASMLLCTVPLSSLSAQQQTVGQNGAQPSQQTAQAPDGLEVPRDQKLKALICSTLIALNQANATGNYSVFRELGAPGFQVVNSSAELADSFSDLRSRNFDLSPIMLLQPKLLREPKVTENGMLRMAGFFPTKPERLNFDLMFQPVNGRWLLFGIAANTTPNETQIVQDEPQAPPAGAQKAASGGQVAARVPVPPAKPSLVGQAETSSERAKPSVPDVRDKVEAIEAGTTGSAAETKSQKSDDDERGPLNSFGWFR